MYPRNAWYAACMVDELDPVRPLGRQVCGERLVFFRGPDGSATALEDWCPHRGAPLSLGRVHEGSVVCGYHGLQMGCDGKAIGMPGQAGRRLPSIKRLPSAEHGGFVWVWPGDPSLADTAHLPRLPWVDDPARCTYGGGLYRIGCDYRLMIDNLMDLTHETYVHADSIGQKEIDEAPCTSAADGDHVTTSRFMHGIQAPPFWQAALRMNGLPDDQPVDRWQVCHFTPPSHVLIEVGVALAGRGGKDASDDSKASALVVDFITPETDSSIWYFWGMARYFKPGDAALTDKIREGQGRIFAQDQEMLEAQQRNHAAQPRRALLKLDIDSGGVLSRQVIERLVAEERQLQRA
jgi:vanillate O-demethylase monooxygenase subunit